MGRRDHRQAPDPRVDEQGPLPWPEFVEANPDLFEWPNSTLRRMYPGDVHSPTARRAFVMPAGLHGHSDDAG